MAKYLDAIAWIAHEDDTDWLNDDEHVPSVTASLVADLFGKTTEVVAADLRRYITKENGKKPGTIPVSVAIKPSYGVGAVELSKDALGHHLIYSRDHGDFRAGDPVGGPDYYPTKEAARQALRKYNSGAWKLPSKIGGG